MLWRMRYILLYLLRYELTFLKSVVLFCISAPPFSRTGKTLGFPPKSCIIDSEFPQTFDKWIQGLFKDFQGQQQQFSRIYFKAWPPLPLLLAIRSSHKIFYCHMI